MFLVPDMFEYAGPHDLTEYYVRNTEIRAESRDLIRVKVLVRRFLETDNYSVL